MAPDSGGGKWLVNSSIKLGIASGLMFNLAWYVILSQSFIWAVCIMLFAFGLHVLFICQQHLAKVADAAAAEVSSGLEGLAAVLAKELSWIAAVALIGWAVESFVFSYGVLLLADPSAILVGSVPARLVLLWLCFATLFRFSFAAFPKKLYFQCILGALAVLSYFGGARLSETMSLGVSEYQSLGVIALYWACLLPLLMRAYDKWSQ